MLGDLEMSTNDDMKGIGLISSLGCCVTFSFADNLDIDVGTECFLLFIQSE